MAEDRSSEGNTEFDKVMSKGLQKRKGVIDGGNDSRKM